MSGFLDAVDPLGAPAAAPKKKAAKKPVRPPSSSSSDSSSSDDEPAPPVVKKKKKKVVAAPAPEEDEIEEPAPAPAPVVKKKKPVAPPPEDDEDEEEEVVVAPKKKKAAAAAPAPVPAPVVAVPAAAPKKVKKKKVVESSSSDSSDSSDSDDSEEGAPPRKKKVVKKKAAAAPLPPPGPVTGVNDLLDFFGEPSKPTPAPVPAAAPAKKKVKQPVVESDSEDTDEEEEPAPKKKATKKAAAAEPVVAPSPAARSCSVADCPNPRVKRGYCAAHANDPNAPVAATSMSSFLGDDADEALEGFQDLEVRPTKRVNKKVPRAQGQPLSPVGDVGLDGEDAAPGEYDPNASALPNGAKKSPKDWRIDFENTSTSLGMNKNIITWNFIWKRQRHVVELHHSTFGGKRKIIVDDKVRVQEKKPFADQSRYDMRVGEGPLSVQIGVQLKAAGLTAFTYELYVERMPYDQANAFWRSHPEV